MPRKIPERYFKLLHLNEEEEILEILHQSLWANWYKIFFAVLLALLPFFLMFWLIAQGPLGSSAFVALIVLALFYCFREWYLWTRKVVALTNQRIIDFDQVGLLRRSVTEISHHKIVDISYHLRGLSGAVFGVGSILVKTSVPDLSLAIPKVRQVKSVSARLNEAIKPGKMIGRAALSGEQKVQNLESIMNDDLEKYDQYELKDLIEKYVQKHSRAQLKKMLYQELVDEDDTE